MMEFNCHDCTKFKKCRQVHVTKNVNNGKITQTHRTQPNFIGNSITVTLRFRCSNQKPPLKVGCIIQALLQRRNIVRCYDAPHL